MMRTAVIISLASILATASSAAAQSVVPGRVDFSGGLGWVSATDYGSRDATETKADGSSLVLFSTSTRMHPSAAAEARVGVRITRRLEVEATGTFGTPHLEVKTTLDRENAANATITQSQTFYTISGGVLWPFRTGQRTVPFVTGGVGWVRQLQGNNTLVTVGQQWYAGGGVKRFLVRRDAHRLKGFGIRADARLIERPKEAAVDNQMHLTATLTGSLFVRF